MSGDVKGPEGNTNRPSEFPLWFETSPEDSRYLDYPHGKTFTANERRGSGCQLDASVTLDPPGDQNVFPSCVYSLMEKLLLKCLAVSGLVILWLRETVAHTS